MTWKVGDWVLYIVRQHGKDYIFDIGYVDEILGEELQRRLVIHFYIQEKRSRKSEYTPNSWSLDQFEDNLKPLLDYDDRKRIIETIFKELS